MSINSIDSLHELLRPKIESILRWKQLVVIPTTMAKPYILQASISVADYVDISITNAHEYFIL